MASEPKLTEAQARQLRWIDENHCSQSEWTRNGKRTNAGPKFWTHLKLSGPTGSLLMPREDLRALKYMFRGNGEPGQTMWELTPAGRIALDGAREGETR